MYGLHVHRAVLAAGEAKSGASVHLVNEEYDAGPVIAQCEVPVAEGDTPEALAERVQERERELVVEVLTRIADGRIRLPLSEDNDRRPTIRFNGPAAPATERWPYTAENVTLT